MSKCLWVNEVFCAAVYVVLELESGVHYDVVVLAATERGFPAMQEDDWPWVSHLVGESDSTLCTALAFHTLPLVACPRRWAK